MDDLLSSAQVVVDLVLLYQSYTLLDANTYILSIKTAEK